MMMKMRNRRVIQKKEDQMYGYIFIVNLSNQYLRWFTEELNSTGSCAMQREKEVTRSKERI